MKRTKKVTSKTRDMKKRYTIVTADRTMWQLQVKREYEEEKDNVEE